ncbi:unnamed protein product [Staurois parvus]|uniref:Small integral membrane protein 4 n=1 Tax=Staurois parvus TaxID=386267 RepID=A0ABN9F0I5_9NEOB|nr:unnamed protein product [Staurois parvus]
MASRSKIGTLLDLIPGKRRFGLYRFLPFFFILGGAMEWFMINARIGKETFCKFSFCCGIDFCTNFGCEVARKHCMLDLCIEDTLLKKNKGTL